MTDTLALAFTGSDTGIARLVTDLEEAGASRVTAEPERVPDDDRVLRRYTGQITGLSAEKAMAVAATYLTTTDGHRVEINGIEVPPAT